MDRTFTLLTGATGLLGQFLMRDGLLQGLNLAVLARPTNGASAAERIEVCCQRLERGLARQLPRPQLIEGDLRQPDLGLDEQAREWLKNHCCRVLHSAATVKFRADGSGEPYLTNVDATARLLELSRGCDLDEFHLISTAYVCGATVPNLEPRPVPLHQVFNNDYERSKALAESLVAQAEFLRRFTIYRPSIIVGESSTGYTPNFQGAYPLLLLTWLNSASSSRSLLETVGVEDPEDGINLVPVDWVSQVVIALLGQERSAQQYYHLTNPHPTSFQALYDAVRACRSEDDQPPSVQSLDGPAAVSTYRPYLSNHPTFDCQLTLEHSGVPCPRLDGEALKRLVGFALEHRFQAAPEWDLARRLSRIPLASNSEPRLFLTVPGPEGGQWGFAETGRTPLTRVECAPEAFCSLPTLAHLAGRQLTPEQALYAGELVLVGDSERLDEALKMLMHVVDLLGAA
ncbi:MAG: SDR family oxidoreductase [Vulcanimicrobiota bacterium]